MLNIKNSFLYIRDTKNIRCDRKRICGTYLFQHDVATMRLWGVLYQRRRDDIYMSQIPNFREEIKKLVKKLCN